MKLFFGLGLLLSVEQRSWSEFLAKTVLSAAQLTCSKFPAFRQRGTQFQADVDERAVDRPTWSFVDEGGACLLPVVDRHRCFP